MIWCVLNEEGKAVSWPNTTDIGSAKRIAKKSLGLDRIPKKWKVVPVDMTALAQANIERLAQEAVKETSKLIPLIDPLTGEEIKE